MQIFHVFLLFLCYSFIGWAWETALCSTREKRFINRGFLYGPLCPVYGFGGLLIMYLLKPWAHTWIPLFLASMVITSILEYLTSWGMETPAAYSKEEIEHILDELEDESEYGFVLRAKGMVPGSQGGWVYFDYVPGESNVREGKPDVTGKFCVIGSKLNEEKLNKLFAK